MEELEYTNGNNNGETTIFHDANIFSDVDVDSSCSTPYVSAPSSPGRGPSASFRYFYSAPSSPMHFLLASSPNSPSYVSDASVSGSSEFEFSATSFPATGSTSTGAMTSADELFHNGQIRPMKLSNHHERPPRLAPLLDEDENEIDFENAVNDAEKESRGRDLKFRDRSIRRRTRSMSPMRSTSLEWYTNEESIETEQSNLSFEGVESKQNEEELDETTLSGSASASRSSSAGRSSKRWVFLKDLLYRSKSEGRNNGHKFWSSISFSPVKDRKLSTTQPTSSSESINTTPTDSSKKGKQHAKLPSKRPVAGKAVNGVGKKRMPPSAHEMHYTANRAQAEEMRKKTYLPYRQGLLGCLGFSSKSYGAMNGFARALNPVPSR